MTITLDPPTTTASLSHSARIKVDVVEAESMPRLDPPSSTVTAVLMTARALISRPEHWGKLAYQDQEGNVWCAIGALRTACFGDYRDYTMCRDVVYQRAKRLLARNVPGQFNSVESFNDARHTSHAAVLDMFDNATADSMLGY